MRIRALHQSIKKDLESCYPKEEAAAITDLLFADLLGFSRSYIITHADENLSESSLALMEEKTRLLLAFTPIQHIIGQAPFLNLHFYVNEDVLIPRPETEQMIHIAEDLLAKHSFSKILDIGTGSGCIPIALQKRNPTLAVTSIDVSAKALEVAEKNNALNKTNVVLKQMDFLDEGQWNNLSNFDLILSNPPYIPIAEKELLDKNVTLHEPHLALFVPNENPLLFYKKIAAFSESHLNKDGFIVLETHEKLAYQTAEMMRLQTNLCTEVQKDIFGKDRFVIATRCR
jgi:release factor glutamine methyltransferase